VLLEQAGIALRGTFIIDPDGVLKNMVVQDLPIGRSIDDTLRVLHALQHAGTTGEVCPANWGKDKQAINPKKAGEWFEKHAK
jgi:alkyl hydroperoxide reductase subunit AhpC